MKKVAVFILLVLPAVLGTLAVGLIYFGAENNPSASTRQAPTTADAARARAFAKRTIDQLLNAKTTTNLSFSENDIIGVYALLTRAFSRMAGDASVTRSGFKSAITLRLPKNPFRNYVNLRFGLNPSSSGLKLAAVSIGRLRMSGDVVSTLLRYGLDLALGDDAGTNFFQSVTSVRFKDNVATLRIRPQPELKSRLKRLAQRLGEARDEVAIFGDSSIIQLYYTRLVELEGIISGRKRFSLARVLTPLFQLARDRSGFGDPVTENRAALLALVIYFGDSRFEHLTGPVRTGVLKGHRPALRGARLGGRGDLLLHFIISAGLKIVSDRGVAMTIGEFKELLDSAKGGSGFSFVDLAADRTGLRFAEAATGNSDSAMRLQKTLTGAGSESTFFPRFTDLPEGLSEAAFKRSFGGVGDARYAALVEEIDRRIAAVYDGK